MTGPDWRLAQVHYDKLAGSHTRLAICPTLAICYRRVVIHASLDTRFKGRR